MHESTVFLVRVRCRRKESSRSFAISFLMMNFLFEFGVIKKESKESGHDQAAVCCCKSHGVIRLNTNERGWSSDTVLQIEDGGRHHFGFLINANNFGPNGHTSTKLAGIMKDLIAWQLISPDCKP